MRKLIGIGTGLLVAATLGGCSLTRSTTSIPAIAKGAGGKIGVLINNLSSDASSGEASTICNSIFSTALKRRLSKVGGCTKDVTNQLNTGITSYTLVTTGLTKGVTSKSLVATAKVTSQDNGKTTTYTLQLVNQGAHGGWRINALG